MNSESTLLFSSLILFFLPYNSKAVLLSIVIPKVWKTQSNTMFSRTRNPTANSVCPQAIRTRTIYCTVPKGKEVHKSKNKRIINHKEHKKTLHRPSTCGRLAACCWSQVRKFVVSVSGCFGGSLYCLEVMVQFFYWPSLTAAEGKWPPKVGRKIVDCIRGYSVFCCVKILPWRWYTYTEPAFEAERRKRKISHTCIKWWETKEAVLHIEL